MTTWIFGYGSLVWRPDFPWLERRPARLEGYTRRFYQGSTDHRGVPGAPGRVATLLAEPGAHTWGQVYAVEPSARDAVLARLDHREKNGYDRLHTTVFVREDRATERPLGGVLLYRATPTNPDYLGPAEIDAMAHQILRSRGPSGSNREYLLRLAESLRAMEVEDAHVFALEARVKALTPG